MSEEPNQFILYLFAFSMFGTFMFGLSSTLYLLPSKALAKYRYKAYKLGIEDQFLDAINTKAFLGDSIDAIARRWGFLGIRKVYLETLKAQLGHSI